MDSESDSELDLDLNFDLDSENKQKGGTEKKKKKQKGQKNKDGRKGKNKEKKLKCDTFETANKCNADSDCVWDNGCDEKICHNAEDKETCESDEIYASKCYWDNLDELNKCKHRPS